MFFDNCEYWEYCFAILIVLVTIIVSIKHYKSNGIVVVEHEGITTKIVQDTASCIEVMNELRALNPSVLGLDCEWVGKHKVSLLQLGHRKLIILIRLHKLETIPVELIGIMNNSKVLKVGVGIYNDAAKLRYEYSLDINGTIDINDILPSITDFQQLVNNNNNNQQMFGLNRLSEILLKHPMKYKDKKISWSNWEINKLSTKQIHYAADDAIIGYDLFKKCMELENIDDDIEQYLSFCFGRMDIHHYHPLNENDNFSKKIKRKGINISSQQNSQKQQEKEQRRMDHEQKHRTEFFDNCRLLKPDGSLLFYCSKKSMQWYLRKNLAEIIDDSTVKLLFEPKIKNEKSLSHYKREGVNQCFICGRTGALCQYDVVPKQYRIQMDNKYKAKGWRLHDYIPLCTMCHPQALKSQSILIESLCKQYDVPYYRVKKGDEKYKQLCGAQRAAKALKKNEKNIHIPIKRKIELLQVLCKYFQLNYKIIYQENKSNDEWDEWIAIENEKNLSTTEIINECVEKLELFIEENSSKSQWELHAKAMLEIFNESQPQFIEMWRKHFVDQMKPRYLPSTWTVSTSNMVDQINVAD